MSDLNDLAESLGDGLDFEDDTRVPRELSARHEEENIVWRPSNHLPDPPHKPGWVHRWVRRSHAGTPDVTNVAKAMREGWSVAPSSEYPELTALLFDRSGNQDVIEFGGLILCRISEKMDRARTAYFTGLAKRQLSSIGARMRDQAGNDDRLQFETRIKTEVKRTAR